MKPNCTKTGADRGKIVGRTTPNMELASLPLSCAGAAIRSETVVQDAGLRGSGGQSPKKRTVTIKSASSSRLLKLGALTDALQEVYVESIRRAFPALGNIFELPVPDLQEKALADRSTDDLVAQIYAGRFLVEIARLWRMSVSDLNKWIAAEPDRSARVKLAQKSQAALWDWVALQALLHAPSDRVEIARADKIAQHCRWRAEAFSRDDYGHSIKVTQVDASSARELTTRELEVIARGGSLPS